MLTTIGFSNSIPIDRFTLRRPNVADLEEFVGRLEFLTGALKSQSIPFMAARLSGIEPEAFLSLSDEDRERTRVSIEEVCNREMRRLTLKGALRSAEPFGVHSK